MGEEDAGRLTSGDVVAVAAGENAVGLVVVDDTNAAQKLVSGRKLAPENRPGSWAQRIWSIETRQNAAVRTQENYEDLLCLVRLEEGRLTPASLEALRGVGVVP